MLLLPDGRDDEGFEFSPEADECLRVDGPASVDCDDLESFGLVFVEVLEELMGRKFVWGLIINDVTNF